MNPDDLLAELTPSAAGADALAAAARRCARRRRVLRDTGTVAACLCVAVAGVALLPRQTEPPARAAQQKPTATTPLTADELLDSFGDQPVALVTYPDGTQRLLALVRPAMLRAT